MLKFYRVFFPLLLITSCGQYEEGVEYTEETTEKQQVAENTQQEPVYAPPLLADNTLPSTPIPTPTPPPTPPQVEPPTLPPTVPPTQDPIIDTGSVEPIDIAEVKIDVIAQVSGPGRHPRYMGPDVQSKPILKGENTSEKIFFDINKPPLEFNTCVHGVKLEQVAFLPENLSAYEGWSLVASRLGINRLTPEKPVYFYWAKKVADGEIGLVPANFSTEKLNVSDPQNVKIDTGFAVLSYVWIDQISVSYIYPHYPQECKG